MYFRAQIRPAGLAGVDIHRYPQLFVSEVDAVLISLRHFFLVRDKHVPSLLQQGGQTVAAATESVRKQRRRSQDTNPQHR